MPAYIIDAYFFMRGLEKNTEKMMVEKKNPKIDPVECIVLSLLLCGIPN